MRRLIPLVFLSGCVIPVGIAVKDDTGSPVDTDLVADTDAPPDTDVVPVDTGDGSLRCRFPIVVTNGGTTTLDSYAVHVDVPAFHGLAADLSNLAFEDATGANLFHWVDASAGGSGTVWVRIDLLPPGDSTIYADACDATLNDLGDPRHVFPLWETWDDVTIAPWTGACENVDPGSTEECNGELGITNTGVTAIHLFGKSSCYVPPYDGIRATVGRAVTLPVGTWELSYNSLLSGEHYDFCSGGTSVNSNAYSVGAAVTDYGCGLSACSTCALPWTKVVSDPIVGDGTPKSIVLTARSGDCALVDVWIDDVWIHQIATPEPTVAFNP